MIDHPKEWLASRFGNEKVDLLTMFVDYLLEENGRQNLISLSSVPDVWTRHIVDSAQLMTLAPSGWEHWLDIGTGAGFPGIIIALLSERRITLVEPRRQRVDFLTSVAQRTAIGERVTVVGGKIETAAIDQPDVISARAVAHASKLFNMTKRFASGCTYLLPKGESAAEELRDVRECWSGMFHVEPSLTNERSGILVATGVKRKRA